MESHFVPTHLDCFCFARMELLLALVVNIYLLGINRKGRDEEKTMMVIDSGEGGGQLP